MMAPVSGLAARALQAAGPTDVAPGARRVIAGSPERPGGAGAAGGPAFGDTLKMAVDRADAAQKTADAQVEAFVSGESQNVHEVTIAMNQAELHFQLLAEVRNKLLDGYQELMRMQV